MAHSDWLIGGERRTAAADRIYAAATELVVRDGLDALDIDTLAERVHCSRATVYRYAGGKAQIRDAVLLRMAARIVESVRDAVSELSGTERVVEAIVVALQHIRSDPMRQMMMGLSAGRDLTELVSSPVLGALAAELTGITDDDAEAAQWIVRVVLSLAYWPMGDGAAERQAVQRFIAPAFG
ncbi:TetR/AcrR family transcriptional regulator [Mycolicibacterium parafortuitum]|uniref:Putative transcriptional regulatory protein [Mycobacterium tuberculosis H37Rv] n=1 Tax=Mycolicibacterium parafortuitum TaxID=39692 RepID=A0A375YF28_MYCPF|nr:TetR/AcrR family transcriptional regulator [Mycolicibacterium parafortuitum]ORB31533.1 TetR family transcriptional regulator [Mycolicibacterium parafortuitum]SRX79700.1 putative transcriptional regulatory protein [Mycobacterium tuberculosis H37Rv] [Mycolicibacterium parafortuitum]